MSPIVFIHVPKTAGTSFRLGAEQFFGEDGICRDYGSGSSETSDIVEKWVFQTPDLWEFQRAFRQKEYRFLTGHFGVGRYIPVFPAGRMVTFLRDPIQRTISEHRHLVRHAGYEGSLEEYLRSESAINRQHKLLSGLPWIALGLVGITERYDDSLAILKQKFGVDIPRLETNTGRENWREPYTLPTELEQEFRRLNAADIRLYDLATKQLEWRVRLARQGDSFVAGMITEYRGGVLYGWAFAEQGDASPFLQVSVNGKLVAEVGARQYRPGLRAFGVPRAALVGFAVKLPGLTAEDRIECNVATSGQPLLNSPWRLPRQAVKS